MPLFPHHPARFVTASVARLPIDLVIGLEVFCDQLFASGQTIAATHPLLLRSSNNVMELTNRRDTYSACWDPGPSFGVRLCEKSPTSTWTRFTLRSSSAIIRSCEASP